MDFQLCFITVNCSTAVACSDVVGAAATALAQSTSLAVSVSILLAVTVTNLVTSGSEHLIRDKYTQGVFESAADPVMASCVTSCKVAVSV